MTETDKSLHSQERDIVERIKRALSMCVHCDHTFHGAFACDVGMVECGCEDEVAGPPDDPYALLREAATEIERLRKERDDALHLREAWLLTSDDALRILREAGWIHRPTVTKRAQERLNASLDFAPREALVATIRELNDQVAAGNYEATMALERVVRDAIRHHDRSCADDPCSASEEWQAILDGSPDPTSGEPSHAASDQPHTEQCRGVGDPMRCYCGSPDARTVGEEDGR